MYITALNQLIVFFNTVARQARAVTISPYNPQVLSLHHQLVKTLSHQAAMVAVAGLLVQEALIHLFLQDYPVS